MGLATGIIFGPRPTQAQYSGSYQTNIISGVVSNWSGQYLVGFLNNDSADALLIQSNGVLSLSGVGDLFVGDSNNCVVVTDPGSAIVMPWPGYLGLGGASGGGDRLVISNGGTVLSSGGAIIAGANTGPANSVVVTDPGSLWTNGYVSYIGYTNAGCSLVIRNGGGVVSGGGFQGYLTYIGYDPTSSNATVLVTDPGSVWTNGSILYVGYGGAGDSLVVSNGSKVFSAGSYVGNATTANGNCVQVVGPGSIWVNTGLASPLGPLRIGISGSSNSLVIAHGGQVLDHICQTGVSSNSVNNTVLVTDSGSVWSNNPIGIEDSGLTIGLSGAGNSLVISNSGLVFDSVATVGSALGSGSNSVIVTAGGVWQTAGALTVGNQGSSNRLLVAGGSVFAQSLTVGAASPTCDNAVELDSGNLIVTNHGTGVLEVRNGQLILSGGVLRVDTLVMTNSCAEFIHNGGSLIVSNVVLDPNTFRITSIAPQGNDVLITWLMGPGATNALQVTNGDANGNYKTNGFTDVFIVTNNPTVGAATNYLDVGGATNGPARYYRARLAP
jgi:T5SS/PEP-CTERM-associated repeat protein